MIAYKDKGFEKGDKVIIKTLENEKYLGEITDIYVWADLKHDYVQTVVLETFDGGIKEIDDYWIAEMDYL